MARNRKAQSATVRFGPAVKAFLLCLLLGGTGAGYVRQKNQLMLLARQQEQLEKRLRDQVELRRNWMRKLSALQAPQQLEAQVKRMNLGLLPTPPDQVVRLTDGPVEANQPMQPRLYAEQAAGAAREQVTR